MAGSSWNTVIGADGGFIAIDYTKPRFIYAETQRRGFRRSTDGGDSFNPAVAGISDPTSEFLFITPFSMDPNNPKRLWMGGQRMWRTKNRARRWKAASARFSSVAKVSAVAVATGSSDHILAAMTDGTIRRSREGLTADGETVWPRSKPRSGYVSSLAFDPRDRSVAYATYAGFGGEHVWRSIDGGRSWTSVDGSGAGRLPDLPVHSIALDPVDPERWYLGTDLGVFVTLNAGSTWRVENTGFANVLTESLSVVSPAAGPSLLFAFTHGRGAFRVELDGSGAPPPPPPANGCALPSGHGRFCDVCAPCAAGEGDCDQDSDCASGLVCGSNLGSQFGFSPNIDVCVPGGGACPLDSGNGRFCTECGPCAAGEGDCDSDAECASGLVCTSNVGADFGFNPKVDVCLAPSG